MNSIGRNVKTVRDKLGLKQKEFAAEIGTNQATVQAWETGHSVPGGKLLEAIHKQFKINLNWLLTNEGDPYTSETEPGAEAAAEAEAPAQAPPSAAAAAPPMAVDEGATIAQDMALAAQVLSSKTHYATALHLNIRSFAAGLQDLSRSEEMAAVKDRLRDLEQKLEAIQEENTSLRRELVELKSRTNPGDGDEDAAPDTEKKAM